MGEPLLTGMVLGTDDWVEGLVPRRCIKTLRRGAWLGFWSLVLPASLYFLMAFFTLDALDLSSTGDNMLLVVAAGVLAGLGIGFGFGLRDWRILIPPIAAGVVGLGIYPLLESGWADDYVTLAYAMVWVGQAVALWVTTWLSLRKSAPERTEVDNPQEGDKSLG